MEGAKKEGGEEGRKKGEKKGLRRTGGRKKNWRGRISDLRTSSCTCNCGH